VDGGGGRDQLLVDVEVVDGRWRRVSVLRGREGKRKQEPYLNKPNKRYEGGGRVISNSRVRNSA
jgi:hypothetical protein